MNVGENDKEECYKSFQVIGENCVMAVKISTQFNLVGLTTWEAGFFLAEFFYFNKELLHDKNCLEMGAGIGITSLVISKFLMPSKLIVTDYNQNILDNMNHNFEISKIQSK